SASTCCAPRSAPGSACAGSAPSCACRRIPGGCARACTRSARSAAKPTTSTAGPSTWTSRMPMPCASRTTTGARRCSRCWLSRADPPPRIERLTHAPAACPLGDQMAWNIPGGSGKDGRNPRRRGGGSPLDRLLDPLRGVFGGDGDGGGAGPARWIAIAIVAWLLFNSFTLIAEQQRGVVLRFGEVARVMQPGPHLKWPWPIERVAKVDATSIKNFNDTVPVLTRDENIVTVEVNVQYRVDDPILYLFGTRNADEVLQQATLSAVREQVGRSDLDTVLSARSALSVSARERLQAALQEYRTGLIVTELNLPNARPPEEVKPAFDDVNSAQQDKERLENEAEAYASKIVPEARGQAARVRTEAEGYKTAVIAEATGDAQRFSLLLDA